MLRRRRHISPPPPRFENSVPGRPGTDDSHCEMQLPAWHFLLIGLPVTPFLRQRSFFSQVKVASLPVFERRRRDGWLRRCGKSWRLYMPLTCSLIWILKKNTWGMYFNVHTLWYTCQQKLHNWACGKTTRCNLLRGAFQIFVLTAGEGGRVVSSTSFTATQRGSCQLAT